MTLRVLEALHLKFEDVATANVDNPAADGGTAMPVGSLGLSARIANCLAANNLTTGAQLVQMTDDELLGLPGLDGQALQEISKKLAAGGFPR